MTFCDMPCAKMQNSPSVESFSSLQNSIVSCASAVSPIGNFSGISSRATFLSSWLSFNAEAVDCSTISPNGLSKARVSFSIVIRTSAFAGDMPLMRLRAISFASPTETSSRFLFSSTHFAITFSPVESTCSNRAAA